MKFVFSISYLFLCITYFPINAQDLTKEDYERGISYISKNLTNKTVFNLHTDVNWFSDSSGYYFVEHDLEGSNHMMVAFSTLEVTRLFNHIKLASAISLLTGSEVEASELNFTNLNKTGNEITFLHDGHQYKWDLEDETLMAIAQHSNQTEGSISPDGKWIVFAKEHNLYLQSTKNKKAKQLTFDGTKERSYGSYYGWFDKMYGENSNRPERFNLVWSPDSKYFYTRLTDISKAEKMYMLDYSQDSLFKPALVSYFRGSPGDTNIVYYEPMVFDVKKKKRVAIDLGRNAHFKPGTINWSDQEGELIYRRKERGFLKQTFYKVDLEKATKKVLFEDASEIGIDNLIYWPLFDKGIILFTSERSGWRQIYSYDFKSDQVKALTKGKYFVQDLLHFDEENNELYFTASGYKEEANPYLKQLLKVNFDGTVTALTADAFNHEIDFSPDGKYYVDNKSTVEHPTVTNLHETKSGKQILQFAKADISDKDSKGWEFPTPFSLIGKDKKTKIYGAIWKPTNFDPTRKYPIIDATYTGPHTNVFPKSFNRAFDLQSLAELGFVLIKIDGLGTAQRSLEFRSHSYKDMGDNLRDHVLAIEYLADKYDWIDGDRVGIFGHSAGGYDAAHGMLAFPETYKVAVSSSADHDFRMEKAWWPEMYMGWPVDQSYDEVSNVTMAKNLKGKLLIVHGALDDNVNASATYKLAEALIKADKQFDMLIIPSQRHGYSGKYMDYFRKKRWNYFVEHLLGEEPLWDVDF